jgi:hypothetical protein
VSLTLEAMERAYPWIKWREPLPVTSGGRTGFACRICIARKGLKGWEPPPFRTYRDAVYHLHVAHGTGTATPD